MRKCFCERIYGRIWSIRFHIWTWSIWTWSPLTSIPSPGWGGDGSKPLLVRGFMEELGALGFTSEHDPSEPDHLTSTPWFCRRCCWRGFKEELGALGFKSKPDPSEPDHLWPQRLRLLVMALGFVKYAKKACVWLCRRWRWRGFKEELRALDFKSEPDPSEPDHLWPQRLRLLVMALALSSTRRRPVSCGGARWSIIPWGSVAWKISSVSYLTSAMVSFFLYFILCSRYC